MRRLRLMLHLERVPQAAVGSVHTYGVQALPGHRFSLFFLLSFLFLLWFFSRSVACCSLGVRAAYTAVYDRYSFSRPLPCSFCQVFRQLAAANVLAVLGECVCFCSRGAFSHISPPPRASIRLELAFTHTHRHTHTQTDRQTDRLEPAL